MVEISVEEINGSRSTWVLTSGLYNGGDRWVARSVGGEIGGSSFDFAMNIGWMARLGFDFAQRE